jgi:hypothetical protein
MFQTLIYLEKNSLDFSLGAWGELGWVRQQKINTEIVLQLTPGKS